MLDKPLSDQPQNTQSYSILDQPRRIARREEGDPLIELGREWLQADAAKGSADDGATGPICDEMQKIERRIADLVPLTLSGVLAQLKVLQLYNSWELDEAEERLIMRLIGNLIAGVEAMAAPGG